MEGILGALFRADLVQATIRVSTSLIFAALGCLFAERSGVLNIGVEGMMLIGAFSGTAGAVFSGSLWIGVLVAMIVGACLGLLLAFFTVSLSADQIVVGVTLNILAIGITSFLLRLWFPLTNIEPTQTPLFKDIAVPLLVNLPWIGTVLFKHQPLVYIAYLLVPISAFFLFRTRPGLILRSTGESARAVDSSGFSVPKIRYIGSVISGILCALGGAYLTLGWVHVFQDNMTQGRGFIGMAALIFGKWKPFGALAGCLLFAVGDAMQIRLQGAGLNIRFEWFQMLPYLLTLIALLGVIGKATPPAEEGIPYVKE